MGFEKGSEVSITLFDPLIFPNGKGLDQFEHLYIHKVTSDIVIVKTEKGNRIQIPIEKISSIDDGLGGHIEFAKNLEETLDANKPVEEKELEVNEEVKPKKLDAETKSKLEGVNKKELELRESIWFLIGSDTPFKGKAFTLHKNGQKEWEGNYEDGKEDGLFVMWFENGQKLREGKYKEGKPDGLSVSWHENGKKKSEANWKDGIFEGSVKYWNSKGEPVESLNEASKK